MNYYLILISMGVLGVTALVAAVLLYVVSLFFKVEEDPRIDLVVGVLPGANCGGCGFAGCRNFAEACVKAGGIDDRLFIFPREKYPDYKIVDER